MRHLGPRQITVPTGWLLEGPPPIIVAKEMPSMSPHMLAIEPSPDRFAADFATPRTCPMVVVTDVDGTLRDPRTGSLQPADSALSMLSSHGVPVVLTSPGQAAELRGLQDALGLVHPFICQNATELHVPVNYFGDAPFEHGGTAAWHVIRLGATESHTRAIRLLRSLYRARNDMVVLIGLGDEWEDRFLLNEVDVPVIVRNHAIDQSRLIEMIPHAFVTRGAGPCGWSEAILGSIPAP
jgi:predicted mannosyl-3-phosphoglycerate phosphatase (HAD superfamily)